mmetsp:Transcript_27709/g.63073  ORF Transcript_27709/g.63073 Transcript_27709/m.63073 type:complete len:339 (+) Transcript_27709:96-1112(+)
MAQGNGEESRGKGRLTSSSTPKTSTPSFHQEAHGVRLGVSMGRRLFLGRRRLFVAIELVLLVLLLIGSNQSKVVAAIKSPRPTAFVKMAQKSSEKDDASSSVLRELKDTIRHQAAEIEKLKKELATSAKKPKAASSGAHSHHGGGSADNEDILDYKEKSSISIASERVTWLAVFLLSLSFTAIIMNGFEHTLSKQIQLAYFVPLMAGHGGNTGGQAVGTVLSALSAGVVTRKDAMKVIWKEALSGTMMGVVLGAVVGPISHYLMGISIPVATVVSVTFPLLSTIAALLGSSLPFVCVVMGLDPAVIAAPAMTSFVDVTGLLCYFLIANQVFRLFGLEL